MTDVTALLGPVKARVDEAEAKRKRSRANPDPIFAAGMMLAIQASSADVPRLVAAIEAVAGLHRETSQEFITASACIREECDCENECPVEPLPVCHHCWGQLEQIDPYFGEDHHVSEVMWPCPTITAVVAALGGGE